MRRAFTLGVLVGAMLGGCGGSSAPSPATYVRSICTSLAKWRDGIRAAGGRLNAAQGSIKTMSDGKRQVRALITSSLNDTQRALSEIKAAGVPATKGGTQIARAYLSDFSSAEAGLKRTAAEAAAIPTSSAAAYQASLAGVTIAIRQTFASMTKVSPQQDPQLRVAYAKDARCQALRSTG